MFETPSPIASSSQLDKAPAWEYVGELEAMAEWLTDGPDSSPALMAAVNAVAGMDTFRGSETVSRWLHEVAAAHSRGGRSSEAASALDDIVDGRVGPMTVDLSSEVSARLAVLEALCRVPDNYRCALLLKEGAGLTVERTARLMKVSTASLRSVLYRARRALRA